MDNSTLTKVIKQLDNNLPNWNKPTAVKIAESGNPFKILLVSLLSSRTRDEITEQAVNRLWKSANSPKKLLALKPEKIEKIIYPVAFYKNKANCLHSICQDIVGKFEGKIPESFEELLSLKGIGRKTANLIYILAFNGEGICVDTHVHRIVNRWGYIKTSSADLTEQALQKKLPKKFWKKFNEWLVAFGQNSCKPLSPLCSECEIAKFCPKINVKNSR